MQYQVVVSEVTKYTYEVEAVEEALNLQHYDAVEVDEDVFQNKKTKVYKC